VTRADLPDARRETRPPRVSVSLVSWNGLRWLPACLDSVRGQTLTNMELLVVDNGSTDGSAAWLDAALVDGPPGRIVHNARNAGYAAAHNRNIRDARGEYVLLLNQDVVLDPGFLAAVSEAFAAHPEAASVQGRLRQLGVDGRRLTMLDSTGLVMHRDRRVVSRAQGELDGAAHRVAGPVWGADGPAPVYRRTALLAARMPRRGGGWEVLDEQFFAYKEDVDLAWRLQRLGWTAWYAPDALAWHARGESTTLRGGMTRMLESRRSTSPHVKALSWRNHRLMMIKNETGAAYLRDFPWILRRELLSLGFQLVADPGVLTSVPSLVRALPGAMRKRQRLSRLAAHGRRRREHC
jgi:GT2 family glycosyltransferase